MNENIDLTKILKNCPIGTEFYHLLYNKVYFVRIEEDNDYPIYFSSYPNALANITVTKNGKHFKDFDGDCIIFPSKEQRDWSKFTAPWYNKENIDLTKILKDCPNGTKLYSLVHGEVEFQQVELGFTYPIVIKLKDGLIERLTSNGKLYNNYDGKCILFPSRNQRDWSKFTAPWYKKDKFDPKTLKPFDKVLVRDDESHTWKCNLFSNIIKDGSYPYKCVGNAYSYCIPYNNDTKHLVGTTEEAPKYYRYWEN